MSSNLIPNPQGVLQIAGLTEDRWQHPSVKLSLVLPTYQEKHNIQPIVELLSTELDKVLAGAYELIIVDDDSPDLTWQVALDLVPEYPQLRVIRRTTERGLATAVVRGWQAAQGEVLGVIDADLQHPPEVLGKLWQAIEQGADLATASRNVEGGGVSEWSMLRRILSRGAQILGLVILPEAIGRLSDPMSGYFLVTRKALTDKVLSPLGYKILVEVVGRGDIAKIAEVGYEFQERQSGDSKVTAKQYVEYIRHLLRLRWSRSRRFAMFLAVGLSGVVVDMAVLYLLHHNLDLPLTRSKILAGEVAIVNNFFWNDRWTFGDVSIRQKGKRQKLRRFIKFNLVCLMGLVLNVIILNIFYNIFMLKVVPYGAYIANFIAIACVTVWNFWINVKLSWRVTDRKT
jgi:dolichol-phosphate mannosyltransferase